MKSVFLLLSVLKNFADGVIDANTRTKSSYSQHGEDCFICDQLKKYDLANSIYIDVGANHPTKLSNTYLLYKKGLKGIIVEPNIRLLQLYRLIRPRDLLLNIGLRSSPGLSEFSITTSHTRNSFNTNQKELRELKIGIIKKEYVPILTLDMILETIGAKWICLLSIDTEGMEIEILDGAKETLKRTLFLCIEANDDSDEKKLANKLKGKFEIVNKIGCNVIFKNIESGSFDIHKFKEL